MDLDKFFRWRRAAAILSLAAGPVRVVPKGATKPKDRQPYEMCERIFRELAAEGLAECRGEVSGGIAYVGRISPDVIPATEKTAKRLLNELVTENQNLVRKLVNQFVAGSAASFEEDDLFQSGLMALHKCLQLFDPEAFSTKGLGASFASYLRHWVRHYLQVDIKSQQAIHYPSKTGIPYEVHIQAEQHMAIHGEYPTAEYLGVTEEQLNSWRSNAPPLVVPLIRHARVPMRGVALFNLNTPADSHCDLEDPTGETPETLLLRGEKDRSLLEILGELTQREALVLDRLVDGASNKSIARELGVAESRICQLRDAVAAKLEGFI